MRRAIKSDGLRERVLHPGQIVHIQGIPVELRTQVIAATHTDNWSLIHRLECEAAEAARRPIGTAQDEPATPARRVE